MRMILMVLAVTAVADLRANDKHPLPAIQPVVQAEEDLYDFEPAFGYYARIDYLSRRSPPQ